MATPNPNIIYRSGSNEPLTFDQLDGNFAFLSQSIADISTINTSSLATTGSNTFTDSQTIVGDVTFPSSSFISTSNESGSLFFSTLNEGTLFLNADGGEGDVQVGYNGWTHKMDVRGPIQVTNIQGTGSLYLKPDEGDVAERQFEIYNTAPSDIHFKGSATHSFFGDDVNYLKIDDSAATITIDSTNGLLIETDTAVSSSLVVTGSTNLYNSGSTILSVNGSQGEIFSITDDISGDLLIIQSGSIDLFVVSSNGDTTISGSILISGSLIPNTDGVSSTSSFSLGSPTNAWKDIYVSNGTINFLDGDGSVQGTLSSTADGISTDGDAYFNGVRVGQGPASDFGANTVLGGLALNSSTTNSFANTAIGAQTLQYLTTGESNTGVGSGAAQYLTTGEKNTAIGTSALYNNQISNFNVALGSSALYNTRGGSNTALGAQAGFYSSGSSVGNIYIGFNAGPTSNTAENNKLYINNSSSTTPLIGGDFSTGVATINSILQLQLRTTNPITSSEGMIIASGSAGSSKLYYYNGTAWVDLTA